jgi:hypothetical protein
MSIDQVVSNVLVRMKGDNSDLVAKMREVQGEERKLLGEQLKASEARNKSLDSQIATIGRLGFVAGTAGAAVAAAFAVMERSAERQRVATQAGRVDLDKLSAAAGGAKTQMQLLSDAAKFQTGALKLNQSQMETVEKAIRQITRESGNMDEVTKKVTDSIIKLNGGGLDDYGIHVRDAKTDTEKFAAIMEELGKKSDALKDRNLTAAESVNALKASFADTADTTADGLGKLALAMTPMLENLATAVGLVGRLAGAAGDMANFKIPGTDSGIGKTISSVTSKLTPMGQIKWLAPYAIDGATSAIDKWRGASLDFGNQLAPNMSIIGSSDTLGLGSSQGYGVSDPWGDSGGASAAQVALMQQQLLSGLDAGAFAESQKGVQDAAEAALAAIEANFEAQEKWAKSPEGKRALAHALLRRSIGAQTTDAAIGGTGGSLGTAFAMRDDFGRRIDEGAQLGQIIDRTESSRLTDDWNARMDDLRGGDKGPGSGIRSAQKSQFEAMFGRVEEINLYRTAFDGLTGALSASFTAWIDGSKSAGEAARDFTKEFLKTIATQALVKAAFEGAEAIASLASYNYPAAAAHGLAAVKYAGVAALAGVAAHSLGGGSSGGSAGGAGATVGGGAGGGRRDPRTPAEAPQGSHQIIIVGDPHALDSTRERAANWREMARRAEGRGGVTYS